MPVTDFHLLVRHEGCYLLCNASNHYANPLDPRRTPTHRKATANDMSMALSASSTEILDSLAERYSPLEFESVAKTLGFAEDELRKYQQSEADGAITAQEARYLADVLSYKVRGMLVNHAAVSHPAILQASTLMLQEWHQEYLDTTRELVKAMTAIEKEIEVGKTTVSHGGEVVVVMQFCDHPEWSVKRAKLERICELLWFVERRLGLM